MLFFKQLHTCEYEWGGIFEHSIQDEDINVLNKNAFVYDTNLYLDEGYYDIFVSDTKLNIENCELFEGYPTLSGTKEDREFMKEIDDDYKDEFSFSNENLNLVLTLPLSEDIYYYIYLVKYNIDFSYKLSLLEQYKIEPIFYVVDDYCSCLVKKDGDFNKVEDRIAFIEKTPRVFINNEWTYGPKGEGGCIEDEGETIYGFYPPSREWCVNTLLEYFNNLK